MMIVGGVGGDDVTIVCQWRHCCTFSCFWWAFVFTFISALSQIYFSFSQFFPRKGKAFWKWCHDMRKWLQIDFLHRSDFSLVKLCDFGSVRPAGDIVIKKVFHCFPPHIWIVSSRSINAMQSLQKKSEHFWIHFRMSCFRTVPQNSWPAMQMNITRYDFISWLLWVLIIMTIVVIWIILSLSSCKTELCKMRLSVMIIYFDQHNYYDYHVDDLHVKLRWIECKMSSSLELLSSIVFRWLWWSSWWVMLMFIILIVNSLILIPILIFIVVILIVIIVMTFAC